MAIIGVDQFSYPGIDKMNWLAANLGAQVTGFYLGPAPNHPDASWMLSRRDLAPKGWGFLPTYVGHQVNDQPDGDAGQADGVEAARHMYDSGFAAGSIVYLDIEQGGQLPNTYQTYVDAWVVAVTAQNFHPGIYCSHNLISWSSQRVDAIWSYHVPNGTAGQSYDPDGIPSGSLDSASTATQYRQNVYVNGYVKPNGTGIQVDLNVCSVPDPSNLASLLHHQKRRPLVG